MLAAVVAVVATMTAVVVGAVAGVVAFVAVVGFYFSCIHAEATTSSSLCLSMSMRSQW